MPKSRFPRTWSKCPYCGAYKNRLTQHIRLSEKCNAAEQARWNQRRPGALTYARMDAHVAAHRFIAKMEALLG